MYELNYKNAYGIEYILSFRVGSYNADRSLSVQAYYEEEDNMWVLYASITVCLGDERMKNRAFIDENNLSGIGKALEQAGIAKPTGRMMSTMYCTYPEYEFNVSKLKEMDKEGYKRYLSLYKECYGK